jgi:hypothetical protein
MRDANEGPTGPTPAPVPRPTLVGELLSLGKLTFGVCLIAFGCWRAFVFAFGPDESLFFAYKVKARRVAEETAALKQHQKGLRELSRSRGSPEEQARERDRLDRELARTLDEQPERDREGYRVQRWAELLFLLLAVVLGPGLLLAGMRGIRWPKCREEKPGVVTGPAGGVRPIDS